MTSPSRRKGLIPHGEQFLPWEQFYEYLTRKLRGQRFFKWNVFYTRGKFSKHRNLKWFYFFKLRLWTKIYDKKIKS